MADFCAQLVPVEQDRFEAILLMSWRHTLLLDHSHDMSRYCGKYRSDLQ